MTRLTIRVDENIDFAIEELARVNKTTKSEVIRDALTKYINGMFSDHLSAMDKRLENIENLLTKELHRYNSLLAKNTLYTIAAREQITIFHGVNIGNKDDAIKAKNIAWRNSVALLQKHYTDEKLKLNNTPVKEEKNDD
jgi:predicted transcriptional regulator